MKLGFRLIEVDTADQIRLSIGSGDWTQKTNITNFQQAFQADNIGPTDTESFLLSFKYIEEGLLLALSHRIEGDRSSSRSNETLWIFIDREIHLNVQQIGDILSGAVRLIRERHGLRGGEAEFMHYAPEALTRDYPKGPQPFRTGHMSGIEFAVIDCKPELVANIIAAGYQKNYARYGYLVMNTSGKQNPDLPHISVTAVKPNIWVNIPLQLPQHLQTPERPDILIDNILIPGRGAWLEEGQHKMTLRRKGFAAISFNVNVVPGKEEIEIRPGQLQNRHWTRGIDTNKFRLYDENNQPIDRIVNFSSDSTFDEKGEPKPNFKYGETVYVPEKYFKNFRITVSDSRFQPETFTVDLFQPVKLRLIQRTETNRVQGNLGGNTVMVEVTGPTANDIRMGGFYVKNNEIRRLPTGFSAASAGGAGGKRIGGLSPYSGELNGKGNDKKRERLMTILTCVFFASTILFLILWLAKDDNKKVEELTAVTEMVGAVENSNAIDSTALKDSINMNPEEDPNAVTTPPDTSLDAAISYLDHNDVWDGQVLDQYPDLRNLYHDLDEFNLGKIINYWGPLLYQSKKFQRIVQYAQKAAASGNNPHTGAHVDGWNPNPADTKINLTNYVNWLDTNHGTSTPAPSGPSVRSQQVNTQSTSPARNNPSNRVENPAGKPARNPVSNPEGGNSGGNSGNSGNGNNPGGDGNLYDYN